MKNFLIKHWAAIVFILTALIDQQQGFLESVFTEQWIIILIRVSGALILSWKWNPAFNDNVVKSASAITDPQRPYGGKRIE